MEAHEITVQACYEERSQFPIWPFEDGACLNILDVNQIMMMYGDMLHVYEQLTNEDGSSLFFGR